MTEFKIIGHRGYGPTSKVKNDQTPTENTLSSFAYALDRGADGIELDIFLTKDNVPIVIHDARLHEHVDQESLNYIDEKGISELNFEEIKGLRLKNGERIPSLTEVLELTLPFADPKIINLDVKDPKSVLPTLKVIDGYKNKDLHHTIIISSYKWDILREFRQNNPDIRLAPAIKTAILFGKENVGPGYMPLTDMYQSGFEERLIKLHQEIDCFAFDCALRDFDAELISLINELGISLHLSTGNDRISAEELNYDTFIEISELATENIPFVIFKLDEPDRMKNEMKRLGINAKLA